jgi:hypothetical protein
MWPWGHAAVGYLLYSAYTRTRHDSPPEAIAVLFLAVGTQFPDLIDKPLAWSFGLLPTGRTLAHSLLFAVPVTLAVYLVCVYHPRLRRSWGGAFALGNILHVLVDAVPAFLWADLSDASSLLWPILSVDGYENGSPSIIGAFLSLEFSNYLLFEFVLVAVAIFLWWVDDRPGLSVVLGWLRAPIDRIRAKG